MSEHPNDFSAFFQHATQIICGTPNIRSMLHKTIRFLSDYIDIDAIAFSVFEEEISSVRRFALCAKNGREEGESLERLPYDVFRSAQKILHNTTDFVLTERASDNPVRSYMRKCGRSRYQSAIVLHLRYEGNYIGFIDIFSEREEAFSREDALLLNRLAAPFSLYLINFLHFRALEQEHRRFRLAHECRKENSREEPPIIGLSSGLSGIRRMADDVAATLTPVLITGETGTGKELIAEYIQRHSDRAERPFIKVNCAAIPEHLLENEFFGHEANAFTGAGRMTKGRFERAHTGTIFLDEIGELPENAQSKLLRVLEYKEMERLGGSDTIRLDVRIIAATNQSLLKRVEEGKFRKDLFYRLNVFPIHLPPLRERKEDIPALAAFFLRQKKEALKLSASVWPTETELKKLRQYDWPGNIRELANEVERALITARSTGVVRFNPGRKACSPMDVSPEHHPVSIYPEPSVFHFDKTMPIVPLETLEREYILYVLSKTNGKIMGKNSAAELLGVNGYTLRKRMGRLGIDPKKRHELIFSRS